MKPLAPVCVGACAHVRAPEMSMPHHEHASYVRAPEMSMPLAPMLERMCTSKPPPQQDAQCRAARSALPPASRSLLSRLSSRQVRAPSFDAAGRAKRQGLRGWGAEGGEAAGASQKRLTRACPCLRLPCLLLPFMHAGTAPGMQAPRHLRRSPPASRACAAPCRFCLLPSLCRGA